MQVSVYFDVTTGREEAEAREALLLGCLRLAEELEIDLVGATHPAQRTPAVEEADRPTLPLHPDGKSEGPRRRRRSKNRWLAATRQQSARTGAPLRSARLTRSRRLRDGGGAATRFIVRSRREIAIIFRNRWNTDSCT